MFSAGGDTSQVARHKVKTRPKYFGFERPTEHSHKTFGSTTDVVKQDSQTTRPETSMLYPSFHSSTELTFPAEWDQDADILNDEELSATSNEEASKVLEQWQADQDEDLEIMEVDEQIGSNLLGEDIFGATCASPTGPLEELVLMNLDDDDDRFLAPLLDDVGPLSSNGLTSLPFDARYEATLRKLEESMRRSQETRKSLMMKTSKTEKYERNQSVSGVLSSIEVSSRQLQIYLKNIQRSAL